MFIFTLDFFGLNFMYFLGNFAWKFELLIMKYFISKIYSLIFNVMFPYISLYFLYFFMSFF